MTIIRIPARNGRADGTVRLTINGKATRIPVGVDYNATASEIAALADAGIPTSSPEVPAGSIMIPAETYGSRIPIGINGVISFLQTGVAIPAVASQLALLIDKGIGFITGGGSAPTPTPTPLPSFTTNPGISGTPIVGQPLSALTFNDGVVANGSVTARAYLLAGSPVALSYVLVPGDAGKAITFQNTANGPGGGPVVATSDPVTVAAAATLNALILDSTTATQGAAKTINILGATSGSTITANQLPAGMTLNSGARTISGTPTTAATTAIILTETLAGAANSPRNSNVSVIVAAAAATPTISGTPPSGQVGQAYSFTPTTTGGAAPLVYTFAGRLPPGTTFNTATGAISGTAGQL